MILPYGSVKNFTHQGPEDRLGLCTFAMLWNHRILLGDPPIGDGGLEYAANMMEGGFNDLNPTTDRGERVEDALNYVRDRGWPGQPTLRIQSWHKIALDDVRDAIARTGGAESWGLLPMTEDGTDYDFTDGALARNAPGVHAHAVLWVAPLSFVTWGLIKTVSRAWTERYWQEWLDVTWEDVA